MEGYIFRFRCEKNDVSIYQYLEFRKEIPGYGVTTTNHHLDVKIKCKIE